MECERIDFLGVPIDILKEEDIENIVLSLLNQNAPLQIIFLSTWDILKARRNGEFKDMVNSSSLCLPVSKSIIKGAAFLKKPIPYRHNSFETIISIL
ncbi:MAG: WecB/TagA/CpsF family glycosyltransferase, partial [Treponema sp.]